MEDHAADAVSISTPEAVHFTMDVAGVGARFAAAVIDTVILVTSMALVFLALLFIVSLSFVIFQQLEGFIGNAVETLHSFIIAVIFFMIFLIMWGYFIFFEYWRNGVTPGKRAAGIRVVKADGSPITFADSAIRNLIRFVDFLPSAYFAGFLSILLSKRNQRLGDLAAGTIVVYSLRGAYVGRTDQFGRPLEFGECRLSLDADEYETVIQFLQRRREFHPERRAVLAARIASAIARKYDQPLERFPESESFLEWLFQKPGGAAPEYPAQGQGISY